MKASMQKVQAGLAAFVDNEMINHMEGWQKIGFGAASALAIKNLPNTLDAYMNHPVVVAFGVVDNDKNIDIDALHDAVIDNFTSAGEYVNIPLIGRIKISKQDIENLYQYIKDA